MPKRRKSSHVDLGRNAQSKRTEPESSEPDILFRLSGDTELHCAASADDYVTACSLVRRGDAIDAQNYDGETPFQLACRCDKTKVALFLLRSSYELRGGGDTVMLRAPWNLRGETPLASACACGYIDDARWLVERGARECVSVRDLFESTPMFKACAGGHITVMRWLMTVGAQVSDLRSPQWHTLTPLGNALLVKKNPDVAVWLILNGAANDHDDGHITRLPAEWGRPVGLRRNEMPMDARLVQEVYRQVSDALLANKIFVEVVLVHGFIKGPFGRLCHSVGLQIVAEYCGIAVGRVLRNAREAASLLSVYLTA